MQRYQPVLCCSQDIGALLDEQSCYRIRPILSSEMQWSTPVLCCSQGVGTLLDEQSCYLLMLIPSSKMQWRHPVLLRSRDIGEFDFIEKECCQLGETI